MVSIKNTLIFIDYSTNFGEGGVELMLTASTNSLALDDGLDGPETVGPGEACLKSLCFKKFRTGNGVGNKHEGDVVTLFFKARQVYVVMNKCNA